MFQNLKKLLLLAKIFLLFFWFCIFKNNTWINSLSKGNVYFKQSDSVQILDALNETLQLSWMFYLLDHSGANLSYWVGCFGFLYLLLLRSCYSEKLGRMHYHLTMLNQSTSFSSSSSSASFVFYASSISSQGRTVDSARGGGGERYSLVHFSLKYLLNRGEGEGLRG